MGRRYRAKGTAPSLPDQPNNLWCADYNGEFMLADRRYCYPLTITDFASRYLFACEALATTNASPNALFGLSKLSVWWLRLGIEIERIKPGHPASAPRFAMQWPHSAGKPSRDDRRVALISLFSVLDGAGREAEFTMIDDDTKTR